MLFRSCVFAKQLLEPILCGHISVAPLLPKLRGHFAEFLGNASSVGLRILSSSTCVGLRYGYDINNSGFSRRMAHTLPYFFSVRITSSDCLADLPARLLPRLPRDSIPGLCFPHVSPQFCYIAVQESQPVVHRLRLSTSP